MKIKHAVILHEDEIAALFNPVVDCASKTYPTPEAQAQAVAQAKIEFETLLNRYVQLAFKFGKKIGKVGADEKDTQMYQPEM